MVYRDEDSILDQIYGNQMWSVFYIWRLKILRVIEENAYLRKYSTLQLGTWVYCYSNVSIHFRKNHHNKNPNILLSIIWSKILSLSLDTVLKVSTTTSPNKLFDHDCVTLYTASQIICKLQVFCKVHQPESPQDPAWQFISWGRSAQYSSMFQHINENFWDFAVK